MSCKRVGRGLTGSVCTAGMGADPGLNGSVRAVWVGAVGKGAGRGFTGSVWRVGTGAGSGFIGAVRAVWVGAAGEGEGLGFTGSVCTTGTDTGWIFATSAGDRVPPSAGSSLAAP